MKSLKLLAMIAIVSTLFAQQTFAAGNPGFKVKAKVINGKVFELDLSDLAQNATTISITNLQRDIYFYKNSIGKKADFKTLINVQEMPVGRYLLIVNSGKEAQKMVMKVSESGVLLSHFFE